MHLAILMLAALGAEPTVFELSAERIVHDGAQHRAFAEGNAELLTDGSALHADRITWDHDAQFATAIGHVALRLTRGGLLVIVADVVTVRFEDDEVREVFVNDGKVLRKKGISAEALRAMHDQDALVHAGETTLLMTGNHLVREGDLWRVDALDLVPCECNFDQPSWSIRGHDASVDTENQRASMWGATVRVHGVPVFWLPWISLPLSDRQTGLLVPKPSFTALNGFGIEQPVFITLGRSFDLTLTPGYFAGGDSVRVPDALGVLREQLNPFGVKGPRLLSELKYAPSTGTSGRLTLGLLWDLRAPRSPVPVDASAITTGQRGLRGEASWQHVQDLAAGWHDRVDASFLSDGYYQRDVVADVLANSAGYLRSTATLFHRGADHWLGVDLGLRQDLSWGYPVLGRAPAFEGVPSRGPNPLHRLPAVTWAIPERPILGPIHFALLADFVRLTPTQGQSGDEGPTADEGRTPAGASVAFGQLLAAITGNDEGRTPAGVTVECAQQRLYWAGARSPACGPAAPLPGMGDRLWQPGEREARDRLQLMPRLSASLPLSFATVTPYAAWRQGVWIGEASNSVSQRGYPLLGARIDSELSRFFGDLRHAIAPAIEVRGVPFVTGTNPAPYDEIDTALPSTSPQLQGVAELRQRLTRNGAELLRLDLGQGVQLAGATPGLGESFARVGGGFGWASASVAARVDPIRGEFTRLSATGAIEDGKGHGGYAGYENLIDEGTDRSRRPIDLLFALPRPGVSNGRAQSISFGAHWRLGGFGLRYDALMLDRDFGTPLKPQPELALMQQTAGVSYAPACDCFRLEVTATQHPQDPLRIPDFGATLTISHFGSFGVSR